MDVLSAPNYPRVRFKLRGLGLAITMLQLADAFTTSLRKPIRSAPACRILVVDDDPDCLEEFAEIIEALGYPCSKAHQVGTALRLIAEDKSIGIVVTDLQMPRMDGFTLMEEIAARFSVSRPLVTLVVTGQSSVDSAVRAMRSNAIDFIAKPVSFGDMSASLRRAAASWQQQYGQFQLAALAQASEQGANAPPLRISNPSREWEPGQAEPSPDELVSFVRSIMRSRQRRAEYLDTALFADPCWDILLELTSAGLMKTPVPTSSACAAAQVPFSTALRHVRHLVANGLIQRWPDRNDKRRTLLALDAKILEAMVRYLSSVWRRDTTSLL